MLTVWLMACGSPAPSPTSAPAPEPLPPAPPPVSIEAELERCVAKEVDRGSEASLACASAAGAAWKARLEDGYQALLAASPAAAKEIRSSQEAWVGFRAADVALGEAVRRQHPSSSASWDVQFEELTAIRDRATRVERYGAASRGEPEPPELSDHPIDQELQTCLRKPEGRADCVQAAVAAWQGEADRRSDTLAGLLGDPSIVSQARDAWTVYLRADEALSQVLFTDPVLSLRERASLIRRRAELLGERIEQLRPSEQ